MNIDLRKVKEIANWTYQSKLEFRKLFRTSIIMRDFYEYRPEKS